MGALATHHRAECVYHNASVSDKSRAFGEVNDVLFDSLHCDTSFWHCDVSHSLRGVYFVWLASHSSTSRKSNSVCALRLHSNLWLRGNDLGTVQLCNVAVGAGSQAKF